MSAKAGRAPWWVPVVLAALCLGLRLPGLQLPLLEEGHAWRQSVTAMVARNFYRHSANLCYPEIDLPARGQALTAPGYTNSEFPLFGWLVAQGYRVTGVAEWLGRLLAALCTVGAMLVLYALVRRVGNDWSAAVAAAWFALNPLGIFYTRAFLPEPLMLLLIVVAIERLVVWVETGSGRAFAVGLACAVLAPMVKQPALHLWPAVVLAGLLAPGARPARWLRLAALAVLPVLGMVLWYRWAMWLGAHYTMHFAVGGGQGLMGLNLWLHGDANFYPRFAAVMVVLIGTVTGWPVALCGLGRTQGAGQRVVAAWLLGALAAVAVAGGATISHYYYNLALVLPLAALVGWGAGRWDRVRLRWLATLMVLMGPLLTLSFGLVQSWYEVRPAEVAAAAAVRRLTAPTDPLLTLCYGTQLLYAADRRGDFLLPEPALLDPQHVSNAVKLGFAWFATGRAEVLQAPTGQALREELARYRQVAAGPGWLVVNLRERAEEP